MKTLSLLLIWLLTRLAWELSKRTPSRFMASTEHLLSDAEVGLQTDIKNSFSNVVKAWVEA